MTAKLLADQDCVDTRAMIRAHNLCLVRFGTRGDRNVSERDSFTAAANTNEFANTDDDYVNDDLEQLAAVRGAAVCCSLVCPPAAEGMGGTSAGQCATGICSIKVVGTCVSFVRSAMTSSSR